MGRARNEQMSCNFGTQGLIGYVACCYTTLPNQLSPVVSPPVYMVIVSLIFVFLRFAKRPKGVDTSMSMNVDSAFTVMIAFKIKVDSDDDKKRSKLAKDLDHDTDVGIDFHIVGHQNACSSELRRFRVNGAKFDETVERCLVGKNAFNYVTIQSSKPIGVIECIEMRITANKPVDIELGELVARSILCRQPQVFTFVQTDMESMKASHPGTWDNCRAASLVQDFHQIRFDLEKRDIGPGVQVGVPLSTSKFAVSDAFNEYSTFGVGSEGSYISRRQRCVMMFNVIIFPYILTHAAVTLIGLNIFLALACIPVGYLMVVFPEYFMRNSFRLIILDAKRAKKAVEDENEEVLEPKTYKPFDPDSTKDLPNVSGFHVETTNDSVPRGKLELNPDDEAREVEDERRIKETFRGTSLEGRLPLRAIQLLNHDGWNETTLETTWPTGTTHKLIDGLAETGVRIGFSQAENMVTIKSIIPPWWNDLSVTLRAHLIQHGWNYERVAYLRPQRLPQYLIELADQHGFKVVDTATGINVLRHVPEWFGSLPEGLQDALAACDWSPERILLEKLSRMPSPILVLISNYGITITFTTSGLIRVDSIIPPWWTSLPSQVKDWTVQHAVNFRLLSASKVEVLKYAAENWDNVDRLKDFPMQLTDELEQWSDFASLVTSNVIKMQKFQKDELEKDEIALLHQYPILPNMPHYVKHSDPHWWRSIPVKYRRALLKNKITAEFIEQKGIDLIPNEITVNIEDDGIFIEDTDGRISVELPRCKWWERLPDEIKVKILNMGYGWHDLYDVEVQAIRAGAKLYMQPHKLRTYLSKAPQPHQVALSRFGLLDIIIQRKMGSKKTRLDLTTSNVQLSSLSSGDFVDKPKKTRKRAKSVKPATSTIRSLSPYDANKDTNGSFSADSNFTISTLDDADVPMPSDGPNFLARLFGKKEDDNDSKESDSGSDDSTLEGPVSSKKGRFSQVRNNRQFGGEKGSIPLQMCDEHGKTVDFTPVTVWAGPEQQYNGFDVENLEAERLLLQRSTLQEDVDDWININRLADYHTGPEIIEVEMKMAKLLSPPLPWFLSECMFEYITESKLPRDLKYRSLIQHPPFCQAFLGYFRKRQKLVLKLWDEPRSTKLYGEMMKHISTHESAPDFMRRMIQNVSNSYIWNGFVKYITETLLSHAEVCERVKMNTTEAGARVYLSRVIKFKKDFLNQFGTLTEKDIGSLMLDSLRNFIIDLSRHEPSLFGELLFVIGTTRPEFFLTMIKTNHEMRLNDELFHMCSETASGCELVAKFFCLESDHSLMRPLLQGSILTKTPDGRRLYQLYQYENNAATKLAREAVKTLERTLEPDVEQVARALAKCAVLIDKFATYINNLYSALRQVHQITKTQTTMKKHSISIGPSHGPPLVPFVSAGKNRVDMDAESLMQSSDEYEADREYDQLAQRTQDEVSSIYTYDVMNYTIPRPRAGLDTTNDLNTLDDEDATVDTVQLKDGDINFTLDMEDEKEAKEAEKILNPEVKDKNEINVRISDAERAKALGKSVKPLLIRVANKMRNTTDALRDIEHINSIDYSLLCQIASNAPRQILLGERSTSKSSYTLEQILAFRTMFTQITEASNLTTNVPFHLSGKVFQPKKLSKRAFDSIDPNEELTIYEVIGQTLEDLAQSVDDEDINGKWWMRVFSKLNKLIKDSSGPLNDEEQIFNCIKQLINGSILERYRKHPNNAQIVREMKIRLENIHKLIVGIELYVENFKEYLAKTENQMRRDFMDGTSKSTETETERIVGQSQLHRLKSQIQSAFNDKMDGTDNNLPLLINLPMRTRLVMEEIMRNLIASGNLMSVEADDEDEFWENEFRKTIIRQPSSGVAPPPRAGCRRPIGLFNRRKLRRQLQVYKRRRFSPFPSGLFQQKGRRSNRKKAASGKRAEPKLAQRITNMIDPPKYPVWVGEFWTLLWLVMAILCVGLSPAMRLKPNESNYIVLPLLASLLFVGMADWLKVRHMKAKTRSIHPAFARKFEFNLT